MECLWRLFSYRQPDGDFHHQDPPVFHVHLPAYDGLPNHHLYGAGFLAKYAEVYVGSKAKSMVLPVKLV